MKIKVIVFGAAGRMGSRIVSLAVESSHFDIVGAVETANHPEIGKDILEPIEIFGLQKFEDSAVVIRARLTTQPLKQWGLQREFNRRVKNIFDERGIEIPFPHRTIYMGEPKQGTAAPMHVKLLKQES